MAWTLLVLAMKGFAVDTTSAGPPVEPIKCRRLIPLRLVSFVWPYLYAR